MRRKTIQDINKLYNVNYSLIQVNTLEKIIKYFLPSRAFRQQLVGLMKTQLKNNCDISDFYKIKNIMILSINKPLKIQNENSFIFKYGITKGKKLYKDYCKRKTKNWKPINCDTTSLDAYVERYGEYEGKIKYNHSCYNNRSYNTQIEYYIKQGHSEEEAKLLLKERQTTFSLKLCISKHGEIEGTKIWRERQDKWQNTLKSKPQEEIDDMNRRKSRGIRREWNGNTQGKIYYIKFYNQDIKFWKIGITTLDVVGGRFENPKLFKKKYKLCYDIIFERDMLIYDCFNLEQKILAKYNCSRIHTDYNGFVTTETFDKDVLKEFMK